MKIVFLQRIIPHYRVPIFRRLGEIYGENFLVFFGRGLSNGSQQNSENISGFRHYKSRTIMLNYKGQYEDTQLRVFHIDLLGFLIREKPDVVIAEPSTNFYNNLILYALKNLLNYKIVWHESGRQEKRMRSVYRRLLDPVIDIMIRNSDAYVTYTSFADYSLIRDYSILQEKIFRAQNTVDISELTNSMEHRFNELNKRKRALYHDAVVFLYIGAIEKRKKIEWLLEYCSAKSIKDVRCLIVGDGNYLDTLKSQYNEYNNIEFLGRITESLEEVIGLCDCVCLPALGGLSVVQALACGKAFIGSDLIENGGIKDYIFNGTTGVLFEDGNKNDMFRVLDQIICDRDHLRILKENAWIRRSEFSVENMCEGFVKAINFVS